MEDDSLYEIMNQERAKLQSRYLNSNVLRDGKE